MFFVFNLNAKQTPSFYKYNELNGFKAKSIRNITESENGRIWIATEQGLWSFDGFKFKQYKSSDKTNNPLLSNDIRHVHVDKNQNLWIGYYQHGISVWNLKTGKRKNFHNFIDSKELSTNRVTGINSIHNKIYVFFHDSTWLEFNPTNYTYSIVKPIVLNGNNPLIYRQIIYSKELNKYYLASSDGMFLYFPDKKAAVSKAYQIDNKPVWKNHNSVLGLHIIGHHIWQNTWGGGILKYNMVSDSFEACFQYNNKEKLSGATNTVLSAQLIGNNEFYIATPDYGIGIFNTSTYTYTFFDVEKIESAAYANLVFKDANSNIWIGSELGLLNIIKTYQNNYQKIILPLSPNPTMQRLNYNYFVLEYQNKIVTGSIQGSGIYIYSKDSFLLEKIIQFPGLKSGETFRTLQAFEYKGELFVNSWSGLYTLNLKNETWQRFKFNGNKELENAIYRCVNLRNNQLLLGFYNAKIGWFDLQSQKSNIWTENDIKNEKPTFSGSQIFDIELDVNQNIVASHDGGFLVINIRSKEIKQFSSYLNNANSMFKSMYNIVQDFEGYVWITSAEAGLLKLDPKNNYKIIRVYNEENGLFGNNIGDLSIDKYGCIWGLQETNIFRVNDKLNLLSNWNKDNGIQFEPSDWGVLKTIGDNIFYGRLNEIIVLNQKKLTNQFYQKNAFYLNEIEFNQQRYNQYNCPSNIILKHDRNSLRIALGSKNLMLNKHNKLRYRLKKDQEWFLIENLDEIHISNLAPGNYVFEISSINNLHNYWSKGQTLFKFKVKAPFYQQWWFILSFLAILSAIFYYFHRVNSQKKQLKNEFDMKLNELKMEALRSQMNPHFIFNSLNSINYYIIKNDSENASNYLKKFSKLVRSILNHSKSEMVTLQEEIDINKLYVELEQMRFNQSFDFKIEINESLDTDDIQVPSMLLQPFIENAVWHGLMHKKDKGLLLIRIEKSPNQSFVISIIDNGIGRIAAAELKSKSATNQKSHGMGITSERVDIYNKLNNLWLIEQQTIDLVDENNQAKGTQINLTFNPK